MKRPSVLIAATAVLVLSACEGFKEALTAHVDVVAKAGSQELSVTRLADLLGKARVPINKDVAQAVADLWVDYQLLAHAAAKGDSLNDGKLIDEVMWPAISQTRVQKFYKELTKTWNVDTSGTEAKYAAGDVLAASHILLMTQGLPPDSAAAIGRRATALRAQVNPANFADMARQNSQDTQSGARGGDLGLFPRGQMVADFEKAVLALKPGEISQPVKTEYGYHIIRRTPFADVRDNASQAINQAAFGKAESTYIAGLESSAKVQVKPNAAATVKGIAKDLDAHIKDNTVVASSSRGDLTAAKVARWISGYPNPGQLRQNISQAPDSVIPEFVKNLMRNELLLQQADSAKVGLDTAESNQLHRSVVSTVTNIWAGLRVAPKALADSAKTEGERERLAATRADELLGRIVAGEEQLIPVPQPIERLLREKYDPKINSAGLDRAVEQAIKLRAAADSGKAAQQPPSAVPMPGQTAPGQPAPGQPPQPKRP